MEKSKSFLSEIKDAGAKRMLLVIQHENGELQFETTRGTLVDALGLSEWVNMSIKHHLSTHLHTMTKTEVKRDEK